MSNSITRRYELVKNLSKSKKKKQNKNGKVQVDLFDFWVNILMDDNFWT